MKFEEFKKNLFVQMKNELERENLDLKIKTQRIEKVQKSYDAIVVQSGVFAVCMNLQELHDKYEDFVQHNGTMEEFAASIAKKATINMQEENRVTQWIDNMNYETLKDNLSLQVIGREKNQEVLQDTVHKDFADMSLIYRTSIGKYGSIVVSKALLKQWGVTEQQLHEDALKRCTRDFPARMAPLLHCVTHGLDEVNTKLPEIKDLSADICDIAYVATTCYENGACVIAYPDFMRQVSEAIGDSFFVLPSSIHEVIIIPDRWGADVAQLKNLVAEVNETEVRPEEKLTDNVYHYDQIEQIFEPAEDYELRMAQHGVQFS